MCVCPQLAIPSTPGRHRWFAILGTWLGRRIGQAVRTLRRPCEYCSPVQWQRAGDVGFTFRSRGVRLGVIAVSVAHLRCNACPVQLSSPVACSECRVSWFMRGSVPLRFFPSFREGPAFWGFRRSVVTATPIFRALSSPSVPSFSAGGVVPHGHALAGAHSESSASVARFGTWTCAGRLVVRSIGHADPTHRSSSKGYSISYRRPRVVLSRIDRGEYID